MSIYRSPGAMSYYHSPSSIAITTPRDSPSNPSLLTTELSPGTKRTPPNYLPKDLFKPTPPTKESAPLLQSASNTSDVLATPSQLTARMPRAEIDDQDAADASIVDLVSDGGESWDDWNNLREPVHSPADPLHSPAMTGPAAPDRVSSIPMSEPAADEDDLPSLNPARPTRLGENATEQATLAGLSPLDRPLQDALRPVGDEDDDLLVSNIPLSAMDHNKTSDTSSTLPSTIRSVLNEWYARNGHQRPPPCATTVSKKTTLHCDYKNRPAIYTDKNGEVLTTQLFALPEFLDSTKTTHKYVLVAQGATFGSSIIGYLRNMSRGNGSHVTEYCVWKGIRGGDRNGWDENMLVEKRCKTQPPMTKMRHDGKVVQALEASVISSRYPIAENMMKANLGNDSDILRIPPSSRIPSTIRKLINEWCLRQGPGHTLPFATKTKDPHITSSYNGTPAYFKHDHGVILDVVLCSLDSQRPQDQGCNVIIAQGQDLGPFLIMQSSTGEGKGRSTCIYYFTWIGVSGDLNGFADTFTIAKYFVNPPKTKDKHSLISDVHKRVSETSDQSRFMSKRRRLETSADGFLESSASLEEHVRNNAVLLFFCTHSETPRVRLFHTCDSVQKLFAQALAGELFDESRRGPKILSVKLAGQHKACKVVEDDEDDLESLQSAITRQSCWRILGGKIEGSCTVEVRAVS